MRSISIAALGLALISCGNGSDNWRELGGICQTPRTGIDPATGKAFSDKKGSLDDEKRFLRAWTDDLYLWYNEVPSVDPSIPKITDYFGELRTRAKTASGNPKDRFHFWMTTAEWEALSQSGVEVGYGITWVVLSKSGDPRRWVVGFVEPGSPADGKIPRGAQLMTVDNVDFVNGTDTKTLNAGLFPAAVNETHKLVIQPFGTTTQTPVDLVSAAVTSNPTPDVHVISTANGNVGYILFNDHIATAEQALIKAVNQLSAPPGITDLIIDMRYNGGGYLAIASELAYMIAGPTATLGKTFEQLTFNNKHPNTDPVTRESLAPVPFLTQAVGLSVARGTPLPTLNLKKVYVLTGSGTCSASESVLNSLSGVDVQVIQVGSTTCGKPYGFYPQDNCGFTYFSIQFKGVNAKGFGDYADGFVPGGTSPGSLTGCAVADDFSKPLGDAAEKRLAAALNYRASATCPPATLVPALTLFPALVFARPPEEGAVWSEGQVLKSAWLQNRILRR